MFDPLKGNNRRGSDQPVRIVCEDALTALREDVVDHLESFLGVILTKHLVISMDTIRRLLGEAEDVVDE